MGKIKNLISNVLQSVKETYKKYPVTIVIAYVLTIVYILLMDDIIPEKVYEHIYMIGTLFAVGTLFSETILKEKKKIISILASFIIAFIFDVLSNEEILEESLMTRILIAYTSTLFLITFYKLIKKSKLEFKEYCIRICENLLKCSVTYVILEIAVTIVTVIFGILILDDFDIIFKALVFISGFYYVPAVIDAISNTNQEVTKFVKGLILYVFTPLALILLSIIYMYIVKIYIKGELLKNSLFFILALIFVFDFPTIVMLKNYDDSKKVKYIIYILTYAYIPCILLEVYAMNIRVSDYGITPERYLAYVFVLVEILSLSLLVIKKSKYIDKMILCMIPIILLLTITPLNPENIAYAMQAKRIEKVLAGKEFDNLSDEDKKICYDSYEYLKRNEEEEYISERISEDQLLKVSEYNVSNTSYYYDNEYVYVKKSLDEFDISDYKYIYKIEDDYDTYNYSKIVLENESEDVSVTIDLEELLEQLRKADMVGDADEEFENIDILETNNENYVVFLTYFSFNYDALDEDDIEITGISGYILER